MAALVLLAAALHATWNVLVKLATDRVITLAVVNAVGAGAGAIALVFVPPPAAASWRFLLLSNLIHIGYFAFLLQGYRFGDLSYVYPVARGTAPVLVAVGAALFADEPVTTTELAGLLLVSVAISSFAFDRGSVGRPADHRPFLFALGTAVFISAYTVTDGLGVRLSGSPLGYIAWLAAIDGLPLTVYVLAARRAQLVSHVRRYWARDVVGGVLAGTAYGLVIWALTLGAMAYVSALRETSIIFAAVIGSTMLGEPFGRRRVLAATVVAIGIVLMNLPAGS